VTAFAHRHLELADDLAPDELPLDALDDLLDRGDLEQWAPIAVAIRRDPFGPLADRVLRLCDAHEMYGTSALWRRFIARLRETFRPDAAELSSLRRARGLSQRDVARHMGIGQSDVSKLERRGDVRVSTLRRYVDALGGSVRIVVDIPGHAPVDVDV
jgi:hypothetical protein